MIRQIIAALILAVWPAAVGYAADIYAFDIEEPEFGGSVHIIEAGKQHRQTILLVHGLGSAGADDWKNVIPELSKRYHVIAPDLPGFARSDKGNHLYTPKRYARFLKWVVDRYADGGRQRRIYMVGHSMGGAIALRYASLYPETLKRLVLVDAAGILHRSAFATASMRNMDGYNDLFSLLGGNPEAVESMLGELIAGSENFPMPVETILESSSLRSWILRGNPFVISALTLVQEDFSRAIDELEVPTAIIWGREDRVAPLRTGKLLYTRLKHSSIDVISGAGHVPMNDATSQFNRLLLARLEKSLPQKTVFSGVAGKKDIECNGRKNMRITGSYRNITIRHCEKVLLERVNAAHIGVVESDVEMYRVRVYGKGIGVDSRDSKVMATAMDIESKTAISTSGSRLDLAGTNLLCDKDAVAESGKAGSQVIISVSKINGSYIHSAFKLDADKKSIPCRK